MNTKAISYPSSHKGDTVKAVVWTPETEPCGILQVCHGMREYIERYKEFAEFLTDLGFIVCGSNHIGHKNSVSSEEYLGFFAEENGWKHLVEDQHILRKKIEEEYPSLPYFLFGHSMGSFVTREYITKYSDGLKGYVCCGTSGPQGKAASAGILLSRFFQHTKGLYHRSSLMQSIAFGAYNKRFPKEEGPNAWISKNTQNVKSYSVDPFCQFIFTASGFEDLFTLVKRISSKEWARKVDKNLPIFLIAGEMDPVGQYGKGVKTTANRLKEAGVKDVRLKLYEGDRHEILNEEDRHVVYEDVANWLNNYI